MGYNTGEYHRAFLRRILGVFTIAHVGIMEKNMEITIVGYIGVYSKL